MCFFWSSIPRARFSPSTSVTFVTLSVHLFAVLLWTLNALCLYQFSLLLSYVSVDAQYALGRISESTRAPLGKGALLQVLTRIASSCHGNATVLRIERTFSYAVKSSAFGEFCKSSYIRAGKLWYLQSACCFCLLVIMTLDFSVTMVSSYDSSHPSENISNRLVRNMIIQMLY